MYSSPDATEWLGWWDTFPMYEMQWLAFTANSWSHLWTMSLLLNRIQRHILIISALKILWPRKLSSCMHWCHNRKVSHRTKCHGDLRIFKFSITDIQSLQVFDVVFLLLLARPVSEAVLPQQRGSDHITRYPTQSEPTKSGALASIRCTEGFCSCKKEIHPCSS